MSQNSDEQLPWQSPHPEGSEGTGHPDQGATSWQPTQPDPGQFDTGQPDAGQPDPAHGVASHPGEDGHPSVDQPATDPYGQPVAEHVTGHDEGSESWQWQGGEPGQPVTDPYGQPASGQWSQSPPATGAPDPWSSSGVGEGSAQEHQPVGAADPYAAPQATADPYAAPQATASDPYGQPQGQASTADPYGQPQPQASAADPYAASQGSAADPYAQPQGSAVDPYAQPQGSAADPYAQPQGSAVDPYAQPQGSAADPYAQPQGSAADPYAQPQGSAADPYAQPQGSAADPFSLGQPQTGTPEYPQAAAQPWDQQPDAAQQGWGQPQQPAYPQADGQQPYGQQAYGQAQPMPYAGPPQGYVADGQIGPGMPPPVPGSIPMRPDEERQWAMLGNVGIILLGFLSPLIVWVMYKDRSAFVGENMRRTLNFALLGLILSFVTFGVWAIVMIIFAIIAGMAANRGEVYRYPFNVNWVK